MFRIVATDRGLQTPEKAGDGNRTHVACLEGRYSTIELHPRFFGSFRFRSDPSSARLGLVDDLRLVSTLLSVSFLFVSSHLGGRSLARSRERRSRGRTQVGGAGFEPAKAEPPDLQSGPFGRLGIRPSRSLLDRRFETEPSGEPAVRVELTTLGLQNRSSAD